MKASRLAILVERHVPRIPDPDPLLEQYTTPGDLAARLALFVTAMEGRGTPVLDLGAGTCRLSIALLLAGAGAVVGVEADPRLPPLCMRAAEELGVARGLSVVNSRVRRGGGPLSGWEWVIVMNPPFGVQVRGADTVFLEYAMSLGARTVYAILKSGNEEYHRGLARRHGYRYSVAWREEFPIPASMAHHRSRIRRVMVDVAVFEKVR